MARVLPTPPDLCLSTDPSPDEELYRAGDDVSVWIRLLSKNAVTQAHILERLAASTDVELRVAVAGHTNTPSDVLSSMAEDDHKDVRFAVASNQNTEPLVLCRLCEDADANISDRAEKTLLQICEAAQHLYRQ